MVRAWGGVPTVGSSLSTETWSGVQDQFREDIQVRALQDFGRKIDFAREPDLVAPLIKVTSSTGRVRIRKLPS